LERKVVKRNTAVRKDLEEWSIQQDNRSVCVSLLTAIGCLKMVAIREANAEATQ
jgi:hypothetical protein